jgi:hypothetical protein
MIKPHLLLFFVTFAAMLTEEALEELNQYFKGVEFPEGVYRIKVGEITYNLKTTVTTALGIIERSPKNISFSGHWERLYTLKALLEDPAKLEESRVK